MWTYSGRPGVLRPRRGPPYGLGRLSHPRDAQVDRLKQQVDELKKRITARDEQLAEPTVFKALAISRLAAQHEEIERLGTQVTEGSSLRAVPKAGEGP